jgi:transcriptional regulator with XRE-family HTH domain
VCGGCARAARVGVGGPPHPRLARVVAGEVGFRARLHRNYVGAIERGEINPSFRTLIRLTAGLRIKLSDLMVIYERQLVDAE